MASDLHQIEQALQTYFDGMYEGDTDKLGSVFHDAAHLFGVSTSQGGASIFDLAGSGEIPLAPDTNLAPNGGSQPHNNMQPYLVIQYMVALQGIYPSRN